MSIQTKSYTNKNGRTITTYYAVVWDKFSKKHIWSEGFPLKRDAKNEEDRLKNELKGGKTFSKYTVEDVYKEWKKYIKTRKSNNTYMGYMDCVNAYIKDIFFDVQVDKIRPLHIENWMNELLKRPAKNNPKKTLGPATINKAFSVLSSIFQYAKKTMHIINHNPCHDVERYTLPVKNKTVWDKEQINYFLSLPSVQESFYYDMLCLSFTTAMAPGEICGIDEADLKNTFLSLHQALDKYYSLSHMKRPARHRKIIIPDNLMLLLQHRLIQKKEWKLQNPSFEKNSLLFTYTDGRPINPNVYSRNFKNLLLKHNEQMDVYKSKHGTYPNGHQKLPEMTLYGARHSFASNTLEESAEDGGNIKVVSEIMGNSVEVMLRNYAHLAPTMHEKAIKNYSKKILPIKNVEKTLKNHKTVGQ